MWAVGVAALLVVPLAAMQLTDELKWDLFDFAVAGCLLFVFGLAYELVGRRSEKTVYGTAFGIGIGTAILMGWVNAAVGIIGNEGNPANLLYGAVFVAGFAGSLMARFRPSGMALTLFTVSIIQISIPVIALFIWPPREYSWSPGVAGVFALNAFFASLFLLSAYLFRRANSR